MLRETSSESAQPTASIPLAVLFWYNDRLKGMSMNRLLFAMTLLNGLWFGSNAQAKPTMGLPEVSIGENPYRSIVGAFESEAGTKDLLIIPAGQDFIITAYLEEGGDLEVLRDSDVILQKPPIYRNYLEDGGARLRVEGGATLRIRRTDSWGNSRYYIQGFLVQAGGPDRFVSGRTPGGGTHTVWTAEADRDFIARTMIVTTSWCNYSLDGTPISFDSFPFDRTGASVMGMGRGTFVIPAGSSLTLTHGMAGEPCEYFIEGAYIQP